MACDGEKARQEILYEEYSPYGSTTYRASPSATEVSARRYRYTGKERDEETGLYYYGARYYAAWLGRWTAADPLGLQAGVNLYLYCRAGPVTYTDPDGMEEKSAGKAETLDALNQLAGSDGKIHVQFETRGSRASNLGSDGVEFPLSVEASAAFAGRRLLADSLAPVDVSGRSLEGTYHLWSGPAGKAEAKAAIEAEASGWLMNQTAQHATAEKAFVDALRGKAAVKFPGQSFSQEELFKLTNSALPDSERLVLPKAELRSIWDRPSLDVAARAALSETPVSAHGEVPGSVQARVELPTLRVAGSVTGGLMIAGGGLSIAAGTEQESPVLGGLQIVAGTTEVTGGIVYGSGAILANAELMAAGSALGAAGGAAASIPGSVALSLAASRERARFQSEDAARETGPTVPSWLNDLYNGMSLGGGAWGF